LNRWKKCLYQVLNVYEVNDIRQKCIQLSHLVCEHSPLEVKVKVKVRLSLCFN
jgi:hypothetical protein